MQPEDGAVTALRANICMCCVVINLQEEKISEVSERWRSFPLRGPEELIQSFRRSLTTLSETCASVTTEKPVSVDYGHNACPLNESSVPSLGLIGWPEVEMSLQGTGIKKTGHTELKFVPSGTPVAVSYTLKETILMRALKLREQFSNIPGLTLVPGVLDGTGEDWIQVDSTGAINGLDTGDVEATMSAPTASCLMHRQSPSKLLPSFRTLPARRPADQWKSQILFTSS